MKKIQKRTKQRHVANEYSAAYYVYNEHNTPGPSDINLQDVAMQQTDRVNSVVDSELQCHINYYDNVYHNLSEKNGLYQNDPTNNDIPIVHISEPDTSIISSDLSIISTTDSGCEKVTQILQEWVRLHGPTIPMVNDLLHRLDEVHPGLPADYRSLMGTAQKLTIKTVEPGFYYHFGVCSGINYLTTKVVSLCQLESFNLHIFIDGAKVYKSSNVTIWPIFGRLRQLIECPFVIGIYCGCKKPSSANDFLADCISELIVLISEGFTLPDGKVIPFILEMITCDTQARCFVKGTKACTGYFGCDKCCVEGEYVNGRVCFSDVSAPLRTNTFFRNRLVYGDYIRRDCPFLILPIDMINAFPLDPMHLIYEGTVPKFLKGLSTAKLPFRAHSHAIHQINERLKAVRSCVTHDFHRKPRSLDVMGLWKATEFRLFILYLAPVILKDVVSDALYNIFLGLHTFTFLMSHPITCLHYCDYAENLAKWLVSECGTIWGPEFIVYTIHALIHIPNEVQRFGSLEQFSCFWGENFLQFFTKFCRGPSFTLQQVVKHVLERDVTLGSVNRHSASEQYQIKSVEFSKTQPIPNITIEGVSVLGAFSKVMLHTHKTFISTAHPDCYVFTAEFDIVKVSHILSCDDSFLLVGQKFHSKESLYTRTINSMDVNITIVQQLSHQANFIVRPHELMCKGMILKLHNFLVAFPILHTFASA